MRRRIFIVENDASYLAELVDIIQKEFEEPQPFGVTIIEEAVGRIKDRKFMDTVGLALVDLELRGGSSTGPEDFEGRDQILRALRSYASWVPVLVVSRYLTGDPQILAELSPYGFDAVLPKSFLSEGRIYRREWGRLTKLVGANRVASLTGRGTQEIMDILEGENIQLAYGAGVQNEIATNLGVSAEESLDEGFRIAVQLLDLGADRVVLDEIVQGFSGLSVIKVTCRRGGTRVSWLVKFGTAIGKLAAELQCHRRMFVDGLTREISVPALWWQPVVWDGLGMIAYEFKEGTRTLLDWVREDGVTSCVGALRRALERLYAGGERDTVIPRRLFRGVLDEDDIVGISSDRGRTLISLVREAADPLLDRSLYVWTGPQHGDFHARNILIRENVATFIDFGHYKSAREEGVPLVDLGKLVVDLWAFADVGSLDELLTGEIMKAEWMKEICIPALSAEVPSDEEVELFRLCVLIELARYQRYPDVPDDKRLRLKDEFE